MAAAALRLQGVDGEKGTSGVKFLYAGTENWYIGSDYTGSGASTAPRSVRHRARSPLSRQRA